MNTRRNDFGFQQIFEYAQNIYQIQNLQNGIGI
jgi:hypothetical protein